jgi:hypothetical protein
MQISTEFGVKTNLDEINTLSGYCPENGPTILGLLTASERLGLPVLAAKLTKDQLKLLNAPVIAYVDSNHFLIVRGCKWFGKQVIIQEPPKEPETIPMDDFLKRWSGEAIIFSKKLKKQMEQQKERERSKVYPGAHLYIDDIFQFLGTVEEGGKVSSVFKFTNTGLDTLKLNARASCSCTKIMFNDNNIPSGETGELQIEFNTTRRRGLQQQSIDVLTNDPKNKSLTLTLAAIVKASLIAVPDRLYLGEIPAGSSVTRDITVIDSGEGKLKVEKVEIMDGITAHVLPARQDSIFGLVIPVKISVTGGIIPGDFEKKVTINAMTDRQHTLTIPVSGAVMGLFKVLPPVLFFGNVKPGETAVRELTLIPTDGKPLPTPSVKSPSKYLTVAVKPIDGGTRYTLTASFKAPQTAVTLNDTLSVTVQGKKETALMVPLYARVAANTD